MDRVHTPRATAQRPAWIGLAERGPLLELTVAVRLVADPVDFMTLLEGTRPRIAVVAEPPASPALVRRVADLRRRRPRLRIVHLAPGEEVDARLDALRLGFDDALPDTIAPAELLGRLALLDRRASPPRGPAVAIGDDLVLDMAARELRRDGEPVHLRPKEFSLLAMLAAHPGRVYTRRQLLDRVWGADHESDPRTVDVHIRWLRSKIEVDPAHPSHLVTLRGIGYRMDVPPG